MMEGGKRHTGKRGIIGMSRLGGGVVFLSMHVVDNCGFTQLVAGGVV